MDDTGVIDIMMDGEVDDFVGDSTMPPTTFGRRKAMALTLGCACDSNDTMHTNDDIESKDESVVPPSPKYLVLSNSESAGSGSKGTAIGSTNLLSQICRPLTTSLVSLIFQTPWW
jgi:hypothetical protein